MHFLENSMFVLNAYFCHELRLVATLRSKLRFLFRNTGVDSDFTQDFWGKNWRLKALDTIWPQFWQQLEINIGKMFANNLDSTLENNHYSNLDILTMCTEQCCQWRKCIYLLDNQDKLYNDDNLDNIDNFDNVDKIFKTLLS